MELLYHYCSVEAFLKIISGRIIRLSNAKYMNDYMESTYTEGLLTSFTEQIHDENKKNFLKEALNFYKQKYFLNFYSSPSSNHSMQKEPYDFFIFCFSNDLNSLNQWRAYAEGAQGFAIGFNKRSLKDLFNRLPFPWNASLNELSGLLDIVYKPEEQLKIVNNLFEEYWLACKKEKNADIKLASLLYANSIRFKHPGFEEEKESRLIFTEPIWSKEDCFEYFELASGLKIKRKIEFYAKTNALIPYYKLDFSDIALDFIKDVRLAPKNQSHESDILKFLKQNGLPNVTVSRSEIPYR